MFGGLKKFDTPIIDDMKIYYDFTKKHRSLGGMIPTGNAGIVMDDQNKWKVSIQNANLNGYQK